MRSKTNQVDFKCVSLVVFCVACVRMCKLLTFFVDVTLRNRFENGKSAETGIKLKPMKKVEDSRFPIAYVSIEFARLQENVLFTHLIHET